MFHPKRQLEETFLHGILKIGKWSFSKAYAKIRLTDFRVSVKMFEPVGKEVGSWPYTAETR